MPVACQCKNIAEVSLQSPLSCQQYPELWLQLQLFPHGIQGQEVLDEQDRQIRAALQTAFTVQLGGAEGSQQHWGRCLAVQVDSKLSQIRSSLGNALAAAPKADNLKAIAVVAYAEVSSARDNAKPINLPHGLVKMSALSASQQMIS